MQKSNFWTTVETFEGGCHDRDVPDHARAGGGVRGAVRSGPVRPVGTPAGGAGRSRSRTPRPRRRVRHRCRGPGGRRPRRRHRIGDRTRPQPGDARRRGPDQTRHRVASGRCRGAAIRSETVRRRAVSVGGVLLPRCRPGVRRDGPGRAPRWRGRHPDLRRAGGPTRVPGAGCHHQANRPWRGARPARHVLVDGGSSAVVCRPGAGRVEVALASRTAWPPAMSIAG